MKHLLKSHLLLTLCLGLTLSPSLLHAQETEPDGEPAPESVAEALSPGGLPETTASDDPEEEVSSFDEFMAKIASAKEIGVILIGLSIIGFSFALERIVGLRRKNICPDGLADRVLTALKSEDYTAAEAACRERPSVLADVLKAVTRHHAFAFSDISMIAGDVASRELRGHMQRVYPLAIVATLSPLLGLLGTVIGMVGAFEAVALAGSVGDPSIMASEISYALVTTAMGLAVAVPSLGTYHILRSRTNSLSILLDEQVSELISDWQINRNAANA
ncbi:MAG: MotA/TolQ/ExbB proton channel family protein [Opitutales bacterium]